MGTSSEGTKMSPDLTFDGTAKSWPVFKQKLLKYADSQGFAYMLEAGQSICTIFQAASASAAKSKTTKGARRPKDALPRFQHVGKANSWQSHRTSGPGLF